MRTCLLSLAVALAPPALAQFDAEAPEPLGRLRGRLWLVGAEHAQGFRASFLRTAGRAEADVALVVPPGVDAVAVRARWPEDAELAVLAPSSVEDTRELALALRAVNAAWLADAPAADVAAVCAGEVAQELRAMLARGGMVGAHGDSTRAFAALPLGDDESGLATFAGLDLLPGAFFEPRLAGDGARSARLAAAMESLPMMVGLGVPADGSLVMRERWLDSPTRAWAWIAGSQVRSLREVAIGSGRKSDLVMLSRAAGSRHLRPWPVSEPATPHVARGTLMLGGGPLPPGTLERFIELAGGPDAPIVYVPCLYSEEVDDEPGYVLSLRAAGARNVTWIHTKERVAADTDAAILEPLRGARGIWFGGGRQWNFVDSYQHTEAHKLMHAVLARGGVIGGSSAGASIQADYMARGSSLGNREIMAEGYEEGLGFLTGVAVDQHFSQRGRLPDLTSLVAALPQYLGIGIDEGAVLVVRGSIAEAMGSAVHLLDGKAEGGPRHTILADGESFDLARRRRVE